MNRTAVPLLVSCALALTLVVSPLSAARLPGDAIPPEIADPALAYANALAAGHSNAAWSLLSSESHSKITAVQWQEAFQQPPATRKPSGNTLLKAFAAAETPPTVGEVLLRAGEALVEVSGSVQITQRLVLVKEADGWRVDLAASDRLNSRQAAQNFLDAVRAEAGTPQRARPIRSPEVTLPMLLALLPPEAKDYRVLEAEVEENRAQVTLAADIPVGLVLRTKRMGPGWMVDLRQPLLNIDVTTPDPLKEAAAAADKATCEEQLRQLARAIQMYAAQSDDMLPDPDRWLDQIRPHLLQPYQLRCPTDPAEGVSYAMNRNLAGKRRREIGGPAVTPLLFESTLHTANPSDTGESWVDPPRHNGGNLVLFVDGSVRLYRQKPPFEVTEAEPAPDRPSASRPRPTRRSVPRQRPSPPSPR